MSNDHEEDVEYGDGHGLTCDGTCEDFDEQEYFDQEIMPELRKLLAKCDERGINYFIDFAIAAEDNTIKHCRSLRNNSDSGRRYVSIYTAMHELSEQRAQASGAAEGLKKDIESKIGELKDWFSM